MEEAESRQLSLRRAPEAAALRLVSGVTPGTAPAPIVAPAPDLLILDLPPLPREEVDQRPLAAVYAKPWRGAHEILTGADEGSLTLRGEARSPAIVGELLWALYPGPVGRWDEGNIVRVRLSSAIDAVSKSALLNGANLFVVETSAGWELLQARNATLVGEREYELSGFLRGLQDSAQDAPAPIGARIVMINDRLVRLEIAAHELGEALAFVVPPSSKTASDADATTLSAAIGPLAARPFAPAHIRGERIAGDDVALAWVRCARLGGDSWGAAEPPMGEASERYLLEILDGGVPVRTVETASPSYLYESADQIADFGAPPASLDVRVAQIASDGLAGNGSTRTLFL